MSISNKNKYNSYRLYIVNKDHRTTVNIDFMLNTNDSILYQNDIHFFTNNESIIL